MPRNVVGLVVVLLFPLFLCACGGGGGGGNGGPGGGNCGAGHPGVGTPWGVTCYFPPWKDVAPTQTIDFDYDPIKSSAENGLDLAAAINALTPGQMLRIGPGTYSIDIWFNIVLGGTASAPIWIVAQDPGNKPVLTRPNNNQNVINVGSGSLTQYVCFCDLDITGGDDLIKLYSCRNVWIDQCYIHEGDGVGIAANSANTSYLYITRNEIFDPGNPTDTAEGMYLGGNFGSVVMSYSVVALNHVHDTFGTQGDGIEVKQGSFNNWIAENLVHDCNYPCLIAYGTYGNGINLIEKNILYNSNDNVLQVQGEAIVRNNLILNGGTGFQSHDHQDNTLGLTFVHNTIINSGRAANLSSWNGRAGMVFANNAVYSQTGASIRFPNGSTGVTMAGNVVLGPVTGATSGFITGNGLADFINVSWDASNRDATPSAGSPLIGAGDPAHSVTYDLEGTPRANPLDTGALDSP